MEKPIEEILRGFLEKNIAISLMDDIIPAYLKIRFPKTMLSDGLKSHWKELMKEKIYQHNLEVAKSMAGKFNLEEEAKKLSAEERKKLIFSLIKTLEN